MILPKAYRLGRLSAAVIVLQWFAVGFVHANDSQQTSFPVPGVSGFVSETLVGTDDGKLSISKIKADARVWATAPETTRKSGYHRVIQNSPQQSSDFVKLSTSTKEVFQATPSSLFWVNTKGWISAKSLFPGDELLQRDGSFVKVFNVVSLHTAKTPVFCLEVADFHTYYVGKIGILVHNINVGLAHE